MCLNLNITIAQIEMLNHAKTIQIYACNGGIRQNNVFYWLNQLILRMLLI